MLLPRKADVTVGGRVKRLRKVWVQLMRQRHTVKVYPFGKRFSKVNKRKTNDKLYPPADFWTKTQRAAESLPELRNRPPKPVKPCVDGLLAKH